MNQPTSNYEVQPAAAREEFLTTCPFCGVATGPISAEAFFCPVAKSTRQ